MTRVINKIFVVFFFVLLWAGLIKTALFQKEINTYENRYANQLPKITVSGFVDKTFQDGAEDAFMDQFPLAQTSKKFFNNTSNQFKTDITNAILKNMLHDQYVNLGNMYIFGGSHYVFMPIYYKDNRAAFENRIDNINQLVSTFPNVQFYAYYVEKETDIDFASNRKLNVGDDVLAQINLPDQNKALFRVDNFEQFDQEFFRTDTHWNYLGVHRGYRELLEFLMPEETPLEPVSKELVCDEFSGNKASTNGAEGVWKEPFYAYSYDFPEMRYYVNGNEADDYGSQNGFGVEKTGYGAYYGGDEGEIIFENPAGNGEKMLFIGESYDNAILKLIASHTSELYSIDLRNYEALMGEPFVLAEYLEENDIEKVVLIGNMDYYRGEDFNMEVAK